LRPQLKKEVDKRLEDKCHLGFFPTPLHRLDRFYQKGLAHNIYIKRDDQTGLASGGNKTRKLEYLLQDALNKNCDTLITAGAQQSNHCRQTAAAAAKYGLHCHLLLGGTEPKNYNGNLLLSKMLGAKIHFSGADRKGEQLVQLKQQLENNGHNCYSIPYGGSNLIGSFGFINAMKELKEQEDDLGLVFDHIFFASSSGGTQAGMVIGKKFFDIKAQLHPIAIDKEHIFDSPLENRVWELVKETATYFGISENISYNDCLINNNYHDNGYGKPTESEIHSIRFLANTEGILLDPVYTGRAFNAMIDLLKSDTFSKTSNILFWHTGGLPAIFDYSDALLA
jgi:D-cysteine desulfhydrase